MHARCFIDVFDGAAFKGERRRIYGPARLDARTLGFHHDADVSLRVGDAAAVHIGIEGGDEQTLRPGESVDSLRTGRVVYLEVKPRAE